MRCGREAGGKDGNPVAGQAGQGRVGPSGDQKQQVGQEAFDERASADRDGTVGGGEVYAAQSPAGVEGPAHLPDPFEPGHRCVGGHGSLDAQGDGDVLAVDQDVHEQVVRVGDRWCRSGGRVTSQLVDNLGCGSGRVVVVNVVAGSSG